MYDSIEEHSNGTIDSRTLNMPQIMSFPLFSIGATIVSRHQRRTSPKGHPWRYSTYERGRMSRLWRVSAQRGSILRASVSRRSREGPMAPIEAKLHLILGSSCLGMLAVGANGTAIMEALPTIRDDLG